MYVCMCVCTYVCMYVSTASALLLMVSGVHIGWPTHKPASFLVNSSFVLSYWLFLNLYTLLRVIPTNTQFTCTQHAQNMTTTPAYVINTLLMECVCYTHTHRRMFRTPFSDSTYSNDGQHGDDEGSNEALFVGQPTPVLEGQASQG